MSCFEAHVHGGGQGLGQLDEALDHQVVELDFCSRPLPVQALGRISQQDQQRAEGVCPAAGDAVYISPKLSAELTSCLFSRQRWIQQCRSAA